jgi:menaquinone-dependent protoporphyrinogen oxidase
MSKVLVVYGSRHGGTQGIAERIGEVLRTGGVEAVVTAAQHAGHDDVRTADAFVVGSGVYMGNWLSEALDFLRRNEAQLAARPIWLFSSGPVRGSSKEEPDADPLTNALGPIDGSGSGGRKTVEEISARVHPRDHCVFFGAFDPDDPPRAMSERIVRMMPAGNSILPPGDFRDWDAIEAWAREIAAELPSPVSAR